MIIDLDGVMLYPAGLGVMLLMLNGALGYYGTLLIYEQGFGSGRTLVNRQYILRMKFHRSSALYLLISWSATCVRFSLLMP
ncbi:hypothetical protein D1872_242820 [compost metagenome]